MGNMKLGIITVADIARDHNVHLPYFLDYTPRRQSADCVLGARRLKEQRRQFEC